jgi:hypothetical protein
MGASLSSDSGKSHQLCDVLEGPCAVGETAKIFSLWDVDTAKAAIKRICDAKKLTAPFSLDEYYLSKRGNVLLSFSALLFFGSII